MAEPTLSAQRWLYGLAYFGLCTLLMLVHLMPLSIVPGRIPGPDVMICLTLAWVLRRPHHLPILLIAAMFVMADVLFMRALGLWAAIVVLSVEYLRARAHQTREQTFVTEWLMIAVILLVMTLANRITLGLFVVQQPAWGLVVVQYMATVLVYPLVVFTLQLVFGITKMSASEAEAQGRIT